MASEGRKALTERELAERRRRDRERLAKAIAELMTSDGWKRWLRTRARFHRYTFRNTLLIAEQCAGRGIEPTHIAGFKAWLQLGRCVRKGEKALYVWAPYKPKRKVEGTEAETEERTADEERERVRFRLAPVFDLSQTDPLPDVEPVPLAPPAGAPVDGDSHRDLIPKLDALAVELGYRVERVGTLGGPHGQCDPRGGVISLVTSYPVNHQVAVQIHELCHALLRSQDEVALSRAAEEVVVESATYVACSSAGLATDVDSVPYIAGWAGGTDPEKLIETVASTVDSLARRVEQAIHDDGDRDRDAGLVGKAGE